MLHTPHHQISILYKKMGCADLTLCLEASVKHPIQVKNIMAPTTLPFKFNPSLCLLQDSMRNEGAAGAVAVATSAKEKHGKKALGGLQTLKISNNFGSTGCRNPPQAAKLDGGGSELGTPRKRPTEGTPRKMARGREVKFPFRLDRKKAYPAWSVQVKPPAIAAKYDDPDDRTDQRPYGGYGKEGAPKVPAKVGHSLKIASSNKDDSDNDEIEHVGARKPALLQALAAAKDEHGVEIACADEDDSDNDESASAGARKPAWLQASVAAAKPDNGVSGTPHKKARGREAQFLFRLDRVRAHPAQNAKVKPPRHRHQAR